MADFDLSPTTPNPAPSVNFHPGGDPMLQNNLDPNVGLSTASPLTAVGNWANIQNTLNQNQLFQQTFQARVKSGQILASAPDTETAIKGLMSDPTTAPFAGETINTLRQGQLALTQIGGEVQKQGQGIMDSFYKMLPAVIADPSQYDRLAQQALSIASPSARPGALAAMSSLKSSLFDGLPMVNGKLTPQGQTLFNSRLVGYSIGAGVPPAAIDGLFGAPATRATGTGIQSGVQLPGFLGGGFMQSGAETPVNPTPSNMTEPLGPAGIPTTGVMRGTTFTPATIAPAGNALAPGLPQPTTNLIGGPGQSSAVNDELHGKPEPPGSPNALMQGPSQAQGAANEAQGKVAGDIASDLADRAKILPGQIRRMDMMADALGQFQSGGGADIRAGVGKFMQALKDAGMPGITDDKINKVANSSLPATQIFRSEVRPLVIGELKAAAQGTGRVMRSEVDAFLNMMDENGDPRALLAMLNQARRQGQVDYDQAQKYPIFTKGLQTGQIQGYQPSDYYSWYNDQFNPKNLPITSKGGGMALGPTPESRLNVGRGGVATHRWIPGKGLEAIPQGQ